MVAFGPESKVESIRSTVYHAVIRHTRITQHGGGSGENEEKERIVYNDDITWARYFTVIAMGYTQQATSSEDRKLDLKDLSDGLDFADKALRKFEEVEDNESW